MRALLTTLLFAPAVASGADLTVSFDEAPSLPKGWESGITGVGKARWAVVADGTAPSKPNVLKQSGEATF